MRRHLAVEPCPRPPGGPLVLDGWSQLCPTTSSHMKIQTTKLLELLTSINLHLLRLVVQLVELHKTVAAGFAAKAHHNLKVLRQLSKSIRSQLVKLHSKLNQDISEDQLQRHPKPCCKKLLKMMGSSYVGSGTTSSPGSRAEPLTKYPRASRCRI
jgi:ribosomal protein L31E